MQTQSQPAPRKNITYTIEGFGSHIFEGMLHADNHWKEFGLRQEYREFGMDYDKYVKMEKAGLLVACAARDNGRMIGYLTMFVVPDAHAKGGKMADVGFFYTEPRLTRGLILRGMVRCMVQHLLDQGIGYIRFKHRLKQNARPVLENLGFEHDELSYSLNVDKFKCRSPQAR